MKSVNSLNLVNHVAATAEMPWTTGSEANENYSVSHSPLVKSKLYIKNMVSASCKMVVASLLDLLEFRYAKVELGEVEIVGDFTEEKRDQLKTALRKLGFDLITNRRNILVEKIRKA